LSKRGREAPKSLDALELRWAPVPPFIDSRRDGLHAWEITGFIPFSLNRGRTVEGPYCRALWGMASGVIVVLGSLLAVLGACPCPVAPVGGVAIAVEVRCALR